ncbi:hypothetical protein [Methylobacterium sp. J-067]|uniref:hypothetical protein n=1 Tax=Methylobacterium sp. J-067 TaxID=2836648 RepID=UPI001FB9EF2E|nr:hypothetical protein [Methylobacterium sp. J-067]MCJ2023375.1 hypothetical protein [Methylobacterium sp. J-067]
MAVKPHVRLRLATEDGRRVGKTSKATRIAAQQATDVARLLRSIAMIRGEAEKAQARAHEAEKLMQAVFAVACKGDPVLTVAMVRHAVIEGANAHRIGTVVRYCEMAEEGTLCA